MIHYPLENLVKSGIYEVMIVTGGRHAGHFSNFLTSGKSYGLKQLTYAHQDGEGGIADALKLARRFVGNDKFCVILGDNIYQYNIRPWVESFQCAPNTIAAMVLAKNPIGLDVTRFGVAVCSIDDTYADTFVPKQIVEKPSKNMLDVWVKTQQTCSILTGAYFYTPDVFPICHRLQPSLRGELEISDVNQHYLEQGQLQVSNIKGWWTDAGTFPSLLQSGNLVKETGANNDYP
jgi:glucose-1-phosphate thymidylyltransferase